MRIVGGRNKGRVLQAPKGQATRPTSDRTREAVFNILAARLESGFPQLTVVDLFAGTGALGLEALSRGVAHALFIDNDRTAIKIIEQNINVLGEADNASILKRDATRLGLPPPQMPLAGLVFLDPPYQQDLAEPALNALKDHNWLAEGAICIVETNIQEQLTLFEGYEMIDRRKYGKTAIHFLQFGS